VFNSLKYAKLLEEAGVSRQQAETHMEIMTEILDANIATKQDIKDLQTATSQDIKDLQIATSQDIKDLQSATSQDIKNLRTEMITLNHDLENRIIQSEYRMTVKLGTIVSIAIGVAVTLARLF
jgi:hypothetical protein